MKAFTSSSAVSVALFAALSLAGCGGGGGGDSGTAASRIATPSAADVYKSDPNTFVINPAASWKPSPDIDYYVGNLATVDLMRVNNGQPVAAGRVLEVKSAGSFFFDSTGRLSAGATGLLVNATGQRLTPGSGSAVGPSSSLIDCGQPDGADGIPEDFTIPGDSVATLVVPDGAVSLRLSVADCYYKDNGYTADPIRVTITLKP